MPFSPFVPVLGELAVDVNRDDFMESGIPIPESVISMNMFLSEGLVMT